MPREKKEVTEEQIEWCIDNAAAGHPTAGIKRIRNQFGVGASYATRIRDEARKIAESDTDTSDADTESDNTPDSQTVIKLMREKQALEEELNSQSDLHRSIRSVIPQVIDNLDPGPRPCLYEPTHTDKAPVKMGLEFSDLQCGAWIDESVTLGLGGYSREILRDRVKKLINKMTTIQSEWSTVRDVNELVIFSLGDDLEGENIYSGQKWFLDAHLVDQFFWLVQEMAARLADLAAHFETVNVYHVSGNHGRASGNPKTSVPGSNVDKLLWRILQIIVKLSDSLNNVNIYVSKTYLMAVDIHDRTHLLRHGQDARRYMQVPWYGMQRNTLKYVNLTRLDVRYAHIAHHHKNADWPVGVLEIIANGSVMGATGYSIEQLQEGDLPSQTVGMLHPEQGYIYRQPIRLEEPEDLVADADGIYTPHFGPESGQLQEQNVAPRQGL